MAVVNGAAMNRCYPDKCCSEWGNINVLICISLVAKNAELLCIY
jgi:hypothetical protein